MSYQIFLFMLVSSQNKYKLTKEFIIEKHSYYIKKENFMLFYIIYCKIILSNISTNITIDINKE